MPLTKKQKLHLQRQQVLDQEKARYRDYFLPLYHAGNTVALAIIDEAGAMAKTPDTLLQVIGSLALLQLEEILLSEGPEPDKPKKNG